MTVLNHNRCNWIKFETNDKHPCVLCLLAGVLLLELQKVRHHPGVLHNLFPGTEVGALDRVSSVYTSFPGTCLTIKMVSHQA